jgi:hypothetical protein
VHGVAGTGAFCVMHGGVLKSYSLSPLSELNKAEPTGDLSFVQISDSDMGFKQQHWCWEWELSARSEGFCNPFVFSTPGTYQYVYSIHPKMTGKVIVQ